MQKYRYTAIENFVSDGLDRISESVGKGVGCFAVAASVLMVLEVIMRYGLKSPTVWNAELVTYLCGALYVLSGTYTESCGGHVRVEVLYGRFGRRTRIVADLIASLFYIAFCALIVWGGAEWTWKAMVRGLTSGSQWDPPLTPIRMTIPLGAFLLLLQGLRMLIVNCRMAIKEYVIEH